MNIKTREKFKILKTFQIGKKIYKFVYDVYVSNYGNIFKLIDGDRKPAICVLDKSKGYFVVNLKTTEGSKNFLVHRLVAELFVEKIDGCSIINHINCDKTYNYYKNLEWTTTRGNMQHASHNGLCHPVYGNDHYISKLNIDLVKEIKYMINDGYSSNEIAKMLNSRGIDISRQAISQIKSNRSWKHVEL